MDWTRGNDARAEAGKDSWRVISNLDPPSLGQIVSCAVTAQSRVWLGWEALNKMRQQPPALPGGFLTPALLKHADEQTIATLAAISSALTDSPVLTHDFSEWGVVSAPRYMGRSAIASAFQRFRTEGAWGVSPHLIPHRALHAMSGTISQALRAHGPNFGVGSSPGMVAEPLMAALTLLHGRSLPGVWLTLSRVEPEEGLSQENEHPKGTGCTALVLALTPRTERQSGLTMRMAGRPGRGRRQHHRDPSPWTSSSSCSARSLPTRQT